MGAGGRAHDRRAAERAIGQLIRALGLDPADEPELADTPARVADLFDEAFSGLREENAPEIATFPHDGRDDVVSVRGLPFHSLCVHHLVPFFGTADIAYLPGESIVGISGTARLLEWYARRPQLQERLTRQIADHLERIVAPRGVAVVLSARHLCMEMRGIRKPGLVDTRIVRGAMKDLPWAEMFPPTAEPSR